MIPDRLRGRRSFGQPEAEAAPDEREPVDHALRQPIETVNGVPANTLHLGFPLTKAMRGMVTRVAASGRMT